MVLINDKKFACATCIKGHRVSGCTHTDRPLFEVKKKGRPATQCNFCRDKRKGGTGAVHTKVSTSYPKEADIDASPSVHAEIQSRPLLLSHMPPMPRMSMLLHKSFFSQSQSRMPRPKH